MTESPSSLRLKARQHLTKLNTLEAGLSDDGMDSPRPTDSPRTQVISKFTRLDLHEAFKPRILDNEDHDTDMELSTPPSRKKRRLSTSLRSQGSVSSLPSSPPMSPTSLHLPSPISQEPTLPSTPTRTPTLSPQKPPLGARAKAISPLRLTSPRKVCRRRARSPSPGMTWHPGEITGHEIDPTMPDDSDGLGINGIGFEPTAAEAEKRRSKRREQVAEWRRREEREERRRRAEKRRGVAEERRVGRGVRFAVGDG